MLTSHHYNKEVSKLFFFWGGGDIYAYNFLNHHDSLFRNHGSIQCLETYYILIYNERDSKMTQ